MRRLVMSVLVLTLALLAALGGAAYGASATPPYDSTAECMSCHGDAAPGTYAKAEFTAPVNYDGCDACHWVTIGPSFGFPHEKVILASDCSSCHSGGNIQALWAGTVSTAYGYFASATSLQTPAAEVHRIHASISGPAANFQGYCTSCHGAVACATCHSAPTSHDTHLATQYSNPDYAPAGRVTSYGSVPSRYTRTEMNVVWSVESCTASACHPVATLATNPAPTCASCHPVADQATHATGHDATDSVIDGTACSACHTLALAAEHEKVSSSTAGTECVACHPEPAAGAKPWDGTCVTAGCHTVSSTAPMHAEVTTKHAVSSANQVCLDCHSGTELGSVHVDAVSDSGATGCFVCHTGLAGEPVSNDCTVCHFTFAAHYDELAHSSVTVGCGGEGCHAVASGLMTVHEQRNAEFGCWGCHNSIRADVQTAIDTGDTSCTGCHGSISELGGHRDAHWPVPLLEDASGPHYSYYTGSTGSYPTGDCMLCHTQNLVDEHTGLKYLDATWIRFPQLDDAGNALTCGTCHDQPAGSAVQLAIASGKSACESCHPVHGPIAPVHTSTFVDSPTSQCAECHDANLAVEHNGGYRSTAGLSGCDVCHDLYTGMTSGSVTGSATQAAISTGNDTRCSACHTAYHTNSAAHDTSSAESLACGSCHAVGATVLDVTTLHPTCATCHKSTRIGEISDHNAECASCHAAEGTDYHLSMSVHTAPASSGCQVSGCHHNKTDVRDIHACATCHTDASDPGKTTACANCHATVGVDYHYDFDGDHTPADAYSADCASCHETTDVRVLHETQSCNQCHYINGCTDCHSAHMGGIGLLKSTGCAQCHDVEGAAGNYHTAMDSGHTYTEMSEGCKSCHAQSLPEAHEPYLSRYADYADTCALCHKNADPTRIDWATASADCASCHTVHGDIATIHTPTASDGCVRCHDDGDVRDIHGDSVAASCAVCHNATSSLEGKTAECTTCHYEGGIAYHTQMATKHLGFGTSGTCTGAGCHPSRDVSVVHERFVGVGKQYSQYADSCALCHLNANSMRIDWSATFDGTCFNCHGVAHDRMNHVATSTESLDCAGCHDDWVPATHNADGNAGGSWANCDTCHNNPIKGDLTYTKTNSNCEGCHDKYPSAEKHYPASQHLTTHESPCTWCHYQDLKTEHAQSYVAVSCAQCHTTDAAVIAAGWNKTCDECHADMHAEKTAKHASTRTDCSTSGCHLADAAAIHGGLAGAGCQVCHSAVDQPSVSKNCTDGGCHGDGYHAGLPGLHTATASSSCTRCHDEKLADGSQIEPVHDGACATCHNTTLDLTSKTAECATCHVIVGTDYHQAMNTKHSYTAMDAGCQAAGCHVMTLPEEHAKYLSRYTGYADSCALCHLNADAARIPAAATAACASCHTLHGDVTEIHTAKSSQACADCHETGLALDLHKKADGTTDCDMCHAAPAGRIDWATTTIECASCHGTLSPADPNHYPVAAHDASAETACNQCHYKDMKLEHFKPTVAVTCVACHEVKVDTFTTAWDKTCAACHPTKHGDQRTKHASTTTSCGTGAAGCHDIADAEAIHTQPGGPGCAACHKDAATPAKTTNCTDAACHANVGTNHKALHDAAAVNPAGCEGCHFMNLVDEHQALGLTCGTCHDNAAYAPVITANDLRCKSCHPNMHSNQDWEFNPGRASVHRVSADLPGMRSSFSVNGSTYTMSLPAASTFLKSGWTTSSMMACTDCHTYSGAAGPHGAAMKVNIDPAYPNPFKVTTGSASSTAQLSPNSPTGMSMSDSGRTAAGIICEKCHDLYNGSWSNVAHKEHDDRGIEGAYCNQCHIGVPHGWSRPRMLGYVTDAAPYATWGGTTRNGGLSRISLKNYAPNSWDKSDCGAACSSSRHPLSGSSWPAGTGTTPPTPTTGAVSGTVKTTAGAAISGATVSVDGKTATTSSTGAYSITGITTGSQTMSVTATGYNAWSGSVAITANTTATQNVTLTAIAPTATNLARTGSATASSTDSSYYPSRAIDGSTSTYWRSLSGSTQWLRVDLGATKTVTKVVVNWYSTRYARAYRVETSPDGNSWTQQYSTTSGNGGIDEITLTTPASARYVRVYCTSANDSNYRINEFEVWGY